MIAQDVMIAVAGGIIIAFVSLCLLLGGLNLLIAEDPLNNRKAPGVILLGLGLWALYGIFSSIG